MHEELREEFNEIAETIAMELWWNGQEIGHDGELMQVDGAWAIGVEYGS